MATVSSPVPVELVEVRRALGCLFNQIPLFVVTKGFQYFCFELNFL